MTTLYEETRRLPIATGCSVEAYVRRACVAPRARFLFLHGNPGCLDDWAELVTHVPDDCDVAAIDLPGFGRSRRASLAPASMRLGPLAEHVAATIDALDLGAPLVLVGHSHGGGVAQTVAVNFPERVEALVVVGTLGARVHRSYQLLALPGAQRAAYLAGRVLQSPRLRAPSRWILERVMRGIFSPGLVSRESLDDELTRLTAHPEILVSMVQVALGEPSRTLLEQANRIRCPTLFVHGANDALVPAKYARAIHDRIVHAGGDSRFELLADAGHMLLRQRPRELAALLLSVLRWTPQPSIA